MKFRFLTENSQNSACAVMLCFTTPQAITPMTTNPLLPDMKSSSASRATLFAQSGRAAERQSGTQIILEAFARLVSSRSWLSDAAARLSLAKVSHTALRLARTLLQRPLTVAQLRVTSVQPSLTLAQRALTAVQSPVTLVQRALAALQPRLTLSQLRLTLLQRPLTALQ